MTEINPSSPTQVQKFMDALVEWATEYTSASTIAVLKGGVVPKAYPNFGQLGFKKKFYSASPNQVGHTVGGLLLGFLNTVGGSDVAQAAMAQREIDWYGNVDVGDIRLNGLTMPMGAALALPGGSRLATRLGAWIRKNLCAIAQEGGRSS